MSDNSGINRANSCKLFVPNSPLNMVANAIVYTCLIVAPISIIATEAPPIGFIAIAAVIGFCASFSTWMFNGFPNVRRKYNKSRGAQ